MPGTNRSSWVAETGLSRYVANAAVKEDENENIRPVKSNPKKRIDGVVAAVTALSRMMFLPDRPASPYAYRGVSVVG